MAKTKKRRSGAGTAIYVVILTLWILAIAAETGYQHITGRTGAERRDRTIVFNFSDFDTDFYLNILHKPYYLFCQLFGLF